MKLRWVMPLFATAACGAGIVDEAPIFAPDSIQLEVPVPGLDAAPRPARAFALEDALGPEYFGAGPGTIDPISRCDQLPYGGPDGPSVGRLLADPRSDLGLLTRAIFAATRGHVPESSRVGFLTAKAAVGSALLTRLALANLSIQIKDRSGRRVDPVAVGYAPSGGGEVTRLAEVIAASGLGTLDADARRALDDALRSGARGDPQVRGIDPTTGTSALLRASCFDVVASLLVADFVLSELAEQRIVKPFRAGWVTSVGGPADDVLEEALPTEQEIGFGGLANERISLRPLPASGAWSLGDARATAILNAASLEPPVSPGALAAIRGEFGSTPAAAGVTIGGRPAGLAGASAAQLDVVVPAELSPGTTSVVIRTEHGLAGFVAELFATAPGLYTISGTGRGLAAGEVVVVGAEGTTSQAFAEGGQPVLVPASSATSTTYLVLYGTGLAREVTAATRAEVSSGGTTVDAVVSYAGPQGQPGLSQVNVVLPAVVGSGPARISVQVGDARSNLVDFVVR